jgi:mono/diheme cytochrome c family protein
LQVLLACVQAAPALAGAVPQARLDYMLNCQGCHLADGSGYPARVPDLRRSLMPLLGVEGGREFLLRVPGAATAPLDDARLAAVMNWILGEFAPGTVSPFSAEEVGRLRAEPLTDVQSLRRVLAGRAGIPVEY